LLEATDSSEILFFGDANPCAWRYLALVRFWSSRESGSLAGRDEVRLLSGLRVRSRVTSGEASASGAGTWRFSTGVGDADMARI
jgi:hypothetical protein